MIPFMSAALSQVDNVAVWITAIIGALVAVGWLLKQLRRGFRRVVEIARKIDKLDELASYELRPNGGNSIKDRIGQVPQLVERVTTLETSFSSHLQTCGTSVVTNVHAAPVNAGESND